MDGSKLPYQISNITRYQPDGAARVRSLQLVRSPDNNECSCQGKRWTDASSENFAQDEPEIWEIQNTTPGTHPIHLHLEAFQVLDRSGLFGEIPLSPEDMGWEDTFPVNAGETVRLMVKFEQYTGTFVWHCHILELEDHEMMRPFRVVPVPEPDFPLLLVAIAAVSLGLRRVN
jgi:spore coat protein A